MKFVNRYISLILICFCVILCGVNLSAQFGGTTYEYVDLNELHAKQQKYNEECKRVQSHNEWVKKEEARLIDGKTNGIIIMLVGVGLLATGVIIRKSH